MSEREDPGMPTLTVHGDVYRMTWPSVQIVAELERFSEHRDELSAEVTIRSNRQPTPGLLHSARLNLMSTQTRRSLATALAERDTDVDWGGLVEAMCFLARERYRRGDPAIDMRTYESTGRPRWRVEPFVEAGPSATVMFGDGESGKSTTAIAIAVTAATGVPIVGQLHGDPVPVLYLDYETDEETFHWPLTAMCAASGVRQRPAIFYRRMIASLPAAAPTLRTEVEELGAGLVVVDSLGPAADGDPQAADVANRLFNAIRALGVPTLCIDHIAKNATDESKAFGSVYKHNRPRVTWRVDGKHNEDDGSLVVAFTNTKRNNGRRVGRRAYRIEWETDADEVPLAVRFRSADMATDYPEKATLRQRILAELRDGGEQSATLAENLQADAKQVRTRLGELERRGVIRRQPDGRYWIVAERSA